MLSWVNLSRLWMRGIGIESREKTRSLRVGGGAVTPFVSAIHSNSASPEELISGGKSDRGAAAPLQAGSRIKALEMMVNGLHRVIAESSWRVRVFFWRNGNSPDIFQYTRVALPKRDTTTCSTVLTVHRYLQVVAKGDESYWRMLS
ncbi:hypothetical protein CFAM422_009830 [Trichoderma lentiforme]|uniref:Uncharacterized protein n=1 Tax=Trichoderma lentiforme TaxID=1567552 RepID=A0A9P4X9C5_9HYPO|nr:hypothetical protein CFAM422_009830 [Trichoderma lentiforme]